MTITGYVTEVKPNKRVLIEGLRVSFYQCSELPLPNRMIEVSASVRWNKSKNGWFVVLEAFGFRYVDGVSITTSPK